MNMMITYSGVACDLCFSCLRAKDTAERLGRWFTVFPVNKRPANLLWESLALDAVKLISFSCRLCAKWRRTIVKLFQIDTFHPSTASSSWLLFYFHNASVINEFAFLACEFNKPVYWMPFRLKKPALYSVRVAHTSPRIPRKHGKIFISRCEQVLPI